MAGSAEHDIGMTQQLLHNFLGLQVPDVDHVVLGARHDPLASGDGEVGKNAILFVAMT